MPPHSSSENGPADLDDAHLVGIVLAEERHRAHRLGRLEFGVEGVHREVGLDRLVGDLFDLGLLLVGERALPVEVEPQVAGPVERAGLNRVGAQHLSQRGVHHVGAGVALGGSVPPLGIDRRDDRVTLDELARLDVDPMHEQRLGDLLHVGDGSLGGFAGARAGDAADVGDLTTGLGVQRSAIEHQFDAVGPGRLAAVRDDGHPLAVHEDAENPCLRRSIRRNR